MSRVEESGRDAGGSSGPSADIGSRASVRHPRIEVVRGGRLDAAEAAALTVVVAAHAATGRGTTPVAPDHAWARAARIEATGQPRIDRPSDLDRMD